ncbi:hypothetical protein AB1I66_24740, partial [[Clostridium] symbiosum]
PLSITSLSASDYRSTAFPCQHFSLLQNDICLYRTIIRLHFLPTDKKNWLSRPLPIAAPTLYR